MIELAIIGILIVTAAWLPDCDPYLYRGNRW